MVIPTSKLRFIHGLPALPLRKAVGILAIALGLGILLVSAALYQAVETDSRHKTDRAVDAVTKMLESRLSNQINLHILSLERLTRRWESRLYESERALRIDVHEHIHDLDALLAVGRLDNDFSARWHETSTTKANTLALSPPAPHAVRSILAGQDYPETISVVEHGHSAAGPLLYFYTPVFEAGRRESLMYSVISLQRLFASVITPEIEPLFSFVVRTDGVQVYPDGSVDSPVDEWFRHTETLTIKDRLWEFEVQPRPLFLEQNDSALPETILISGMLLAVAAVIVFYFWRREFDQRTKLNHVFDSTPNGLILVDGVGRMHLTNAAIEKMFGYRRDELAGQPVEMLVDPPAAAQHRENRDAFHRAPQARLMGTGRDLFGRHKNGNPVPVEVGLNPLDTVDGKFTLAAVIDITERKAKERLLEEKRAALRRSNEALENFASMAAHDIREPLRAIRGYSEMLLDELGDTLPESGRKRLDFIRSEATRLQHLTRDLLAYARVDARHNALEPVALEGAVQRALENLDLRIRESGVSITRDEMPTVLGNLSQLTEVLQNLFENAINYRGLDPPRIHLAARRDGAMWRIEAGDNGQGVPADAREHIFEMFYRLHPRAHSSGTGLGLAICKRIVERHGGRIWVEDAAGGGSLFCFTVKAVDSTNHSAAT